MPGKSFSLDMVKFLPEALLLVSMTAVKEDAAAQRTLAIGIGAGTSIPAGSFSDEYHAGAHVMVNLELNRPTSPLGFRLEGLFSSFTGRSVLGLRRSGERLAGVSACATYTVAGEEVRPYALGGIGLYGIRSQESGAETHRDVGLNAGVGARFTIGHLRAFAEGRLHALPGSATSLQFIPLTFGLTF
jgi:hypothetical protein